MTFVTTHFLQPYIQYTISITLYKLYIKLRKLYLLMNVVWKILLMRLFFTQLFVSERKQIAFMADVKSPV